MVLLGFAGAFRRSELVGLDVEDCVFGKRNGFCRRRGKSKIGKSDAYSIHFYFLPQLKFPNQWFGFLEGGIHLNFRVKPFRS